MGNAPHLTDTQAAVVASALARGCSYVNAPERTVYALWMKGLVTATGKIYPMACRDALAAHRNRIVT